MMKSTNKNSFTAAAVADISAVTSFYNMSPKSSLAAISAAVEINEKLERNKRRSNRNGRCVRDGASLS